MPLDLALQGAKCCESKILIPLNLPFDSVFCRIPVGKLVHSAFEQTLARSFTVLTVPIVCWSRTHNVGDIMNIARKKFLAI